MTKGLIFKCTNRTEAECLVRSVFGADKLASDAVLAIEPGDSLFLLNVQSDRLMGVFEADSNGQRDLVSEAWGGRYPFQVRVRIVDELKIANEAKSALDALILKSHQILQRCEVDALAELLSCNGRQGQSLAKTDGTEPLLRQLALKLDRQRKAAGRFGGLTTEGQGISLGADGKEGWAYPYQELIWGIPADTPCRTVRYFSLRSNA